MRAVVPGDGATAEAMIGLGDCACFTGSVATGRRVAVRAPAVLVRVDHRMSVMREETFGPIMPVMPFDDVDEAVRLANDCEFGLSAAVFGPSADACERVAERLAVGAVSINDAALTALFHETGK